MRVIFFFNFCNIFVPGSEGPPLRAGDRWFYPPARPIFLPRTDDNYCSRIHSSLTAVDYFDEVSVGKKPVAWEEYFAKYRLKELQESMDRCTEILLKTALTPFNKSIIFPHQFSARCLGKSYFRKMTCMLLPTTIPVCKINIHTPWVNKDTLPNKMKAKNRL